MSSDLQDPKLLADEYIRKHHIVELFEVNINIQKINKKGLMHCNLFP